MRSLWICRVALFVVDFSLLKGTEQASIGYMTFTGTMQKPWLFKGKKFVTNHVMSTVKIESITVLYLFMFCHDSRML